MTLFISTPNRRYEISELYVMALTLILFFLVARIIRQVIEKRINVKQKTKNEQQTKKFKLFNARGGATQLQLSDDTELGLTILACIADNEQYLVKSPEIKQWLFRLVKAKIKNQSLVLTPNMMRFLALKLIKNDQDLVVQIGNVVLSSTSRLRLGARLAGSAVIGLITGFVSCLPYAILLMIMYFDATEHCGYRCDEYFEQLPKTSPISIESPQSSGHIAITDNASNSNCPVEVYNPVENSESKHVTVTNDGQKRVTTTTTTKTYKRSRKPFKQVNFSEFKNTDPVLSRFNDNNLSQDEPEIPQNRCLSDDMPNLADRMRID